MLGRQVSRATTKQQLVLFTDRYNEGVRFRGNAPTQYFKIWSILSVKVLDTTFFSCRELEKLSEPLSPNLATLQLSNGRLQGRLRIFSLGALRLNLLESNQSLFLSGARSPEPWTLAVPINDQTADDPYRAQGIAMPWIGLMGYNTQLRDFDLRLPPGSRLCTIVMSKEQLKAHHQLQSGGSLTVDRLHNTNQLELRGLSGQQLRKQLEVLIEDGGEIRDPTTPDQLINIIIECFEDTKARTMGSNKREERHIGAIELLHWCSNHPREKITVGALCEELYQSRTSLFKGCKEHFKCTPHELQRAIRLDRVRNLLRQPADRERLGLKGIRAIARHFGFESQSHFSKRYQQHFGAKPQIAASHA